MYAMVDRVDDIRMGVKSTAILFEDADRMIIGVIQVLVLLALVLVGGRMEANWAYYAGLAVAGCFSLYQQYLIKDRIPEYCFRAFLNNHWFGAAVFAGIFLNYHLD
jgi:4-hydroxybenzoate polyprenyltransferase